MKSERQTRNRREGARGTLAGGATERGRFKERGMEDSVGKWLPDLASVEESQVLLNSPVSRKQVSGWVRWLRVWNAAGGKLQGRKDFWGITEVLGDAGENQFLWHLSAWLYDFCFQKNPQVLLWMLSPSCEPYSCARAPWGKAGLWEQMCSGQCVLEQTEYGLPP